MATTWEPVSVLVERIQKQETTATELVQKALKVIREENETYHAILQTIEVRALARATEIDEKVKSGQTVGKLAGIPFIAKDNFLVFGAETTAASKMLAGFDAPYQATAIERLEAEGAICVAKANMDAFAHGGSTENSDFGLTKNPHDKTRVAGGSSGGSAAAVALGMAPFALGTDTGGSIRQPASYCGVVGYKPTYGLVSRNGVVAMSSSTDTIGAFGTRTEDVALVMDVMSGIDERDGTTIQKPSSSLTVVEQSLHGKKIGVIKEYFDDAVDEQVKEIVLHAIEILRSAGAEIIELSLPSLPLALAVYYIVVPAELSSNLARHDGQRFQYSDEHASTLEESYISSRSKGFGPEAKRRIMMGAHVLSSGYYDAYYKKAQTVRTKLINEMNSAFEQVDYLVGPVAPSHAFKIGENSDDPVKMYLQDIMTVAANLTGVPAISVPLVVDKNSLPIGIQIIGQQAKDRELLSFAHACEKVMQQ